MGDRSAFPCVAHVLFRDTQGRVCLLRRAKTGFMDGWYGPPGGHVEAGESVQDAAIRECEEEAGVTPGVLAPLSVLPYRSGRHQGVNFVFAASGWEGTPKPQPEAFDDMVWALRENFPEKTVPWLADVLELEQAGEWFRELRYS